MEEILLSIQLPDLYLLRAMFVGHIHAAAAAEDDCMYVPSLS